MCTAIRVGIAENRFFGSQSGHHVELMTLAFRRVVEDLGLKPLNGVEVEALRPGAEKQTQEVGEEGADQGLEALIVIHES
jgi:hypothetical protein